MKTPFINSYAIIISAALLMATLAFSSCASISRTHHVSGNWFSDGTYRVDEKNRNSVMMLFRDMLRHNGLSFPPDIRGVAFRRPRTDREVMYICRRIGLAFDSNDPGSWEFVCKSAV